MGYASSLCAGLHAWTGERHLRHSLSWAPGASNARRAAFVALALAAGLWGMRIWGWHLVLLVVGYMIISTTVWVAVYQDFGRIFFAFLNLVLVNILLMLTFPHRDKFV